MLSLIYEELLYDNQIDPRKFTKIINEANIIFKTPQQMEVQGPKHPKKSVPKVTKTYEKN